ncbi:MAG: 4-(cytidine 5'-diphospho)-2-C-methyl-D-erythritol kinase [Opitutaceae bacterium]
MNSSSSIFFAPAKLNLLLAVTGRRSDGFHDLISLAVPVEWGDTLRVEPGAGDFSFDCDHPEVPRDETNLVLKAARAFRAASGWAGGAKFFLEKRIPIGAGLGGGSSDAAAALRALNELSGKPLAPAALEKVAAEIGSDCPLFLRNGAVIMRGRGERLAALPSRSADRLRGRRVLVFKPSFGISTPWAYGRLASDPGKNYLPPATAESRLASWMNDDQRPPADLLFNSFEASVFSKHVALPVLLTGLRKRFGLQPGMTGSGSACLAFLPEDAPVSEIIAAIHSAWGNLAFAVETRLA